MSIHGESLGSSLRSRSPPGWPSSLVWVGSDELHAWAFRHARRYSIGGVEVAVAPPEDVITRKLEFYREGGSPKHLRDIRSMLTVSAQLVDLAALEDWVRKRGLEAEWSEARGSS